MNLHLVFEKFVWLSSQKGKGKSGGARVITYNVIAEQHNGIIALLLIYDKSDFSTVDVSVVKQIVHDEGYETE